MNVRQLQERLSKLDPESDVICLTEDSNLLAAGMGFRVLEIEEVNTTEAERMRLGDNTPYLKIGKSAISKTLATLVITGDL